MSDDSSTLFDLRIDVQLPQLWTLIITLGFDDDKLCQVAAACRSAYSRGYLDGDYVLPFDLDHFDDADVDLRLVEIWASVSAELDDLELALLAQGLRVAWCRGFLDGSGEKPFGHRPLELAQPAGRQLL